MKLPYQIRKKMQIGGNRSPEDIVSYSAPLISSNTPSALFQLGLLNSKGDIPISMYSHADNIIQGGNKQTSSPTYGDLMYGANVGALALSKQNANNQYQSYLDKNIGNPLANEGFNDGRSSGVQYGYQQYQQGGNIQNQNTNTMNEHAILTAYLQQVPPNQRQAIMKQLAQLKQTNPQKYQQTLSQLGQSMQDQQGQQQQQPQMQQPQMQQPQMQQQAKYGMYMQEGGAMDQQQDAQQQQDPNAQPQGQGQGQGQDQQSQLIQQVAQMLQQGASPQQVVAQLVKMGMPKEQAIQLVQQVMQQMQGQQGQQGQQQAPQMKMGGKYRKMY